MAPHPDAVTARSDGSDATQLGHVATVPVLQHTYPENVHQWHPTPSHRQVRDQGLPHAWLVFPRTSLWRPSRSHVCEKRKTPSPQSLFVKHLELGGSVLPNRPCAPQGCTPRRQCGGCVRARAQTGISDSRQGRGPSFSGLQEVITDSTANSVRYTPGSKTHDTVHHTCPPPPAASHPYRNTNTM